MSLVCRIFCLFLLSSLMPFSTISLAKGWSTDSQRIKRVEPPSWWTGMKQERLQLMVYGKSLQGLIAKTNYPGVKVESVEPVENQNYLFVNLLISENAKPGKVKLSLVDGQRLVSEISYPLNARSSESANRKGFDSSDAIYLITPDRFANGDLENDTVKSLEEGINRRYEGGRHGGDIQGVINRLDYLADMGFTQIWLNPVLENSQKKYSYHGYSTTDYYQVDARFGSNDLYRELSREAKKRGLGLIKDIILNHAGSGHWWMQDVPEKDWINYQGKFSPTSHKRESLLDPHGTPEDRKRFNDGWFVTTMPDLNQGNPRVAQYLIQNSIWWIEYADLSGIRIDTWPYSDKKFLSDYTRRIMREYPKFNLVGEEWTLNPAIIAYWQKGARRHDDYQSELPSLMDFPMQNALVKALIENESWSDGWQKLYATVATDFVYADPYGLMVFPDNHDMSRIHTQLGHDPALTKMAMAYLATTRGILQVFYGTEILMDNPGTDSHGIIRSDFPGGWPGDKVDAFSGKGLTDSQKDMQSYMRQLLNWRKQNPLVHQGRLVHYAPFDGVYVYFRELDKRKLMVIMNKNKAPYNIDPTYFESMLSQKDRQAKDPLSGKKYDISQIFSVPPVSALILEIQP